MDLSAFVSDPLRILKAMGLLLALAVLVIVIWLVLVVGRELVRHMPGWIKARFDNTNAGLAIRPNTWTDILRRREFLGIADWFITRFSVIGVLGVFAAGGAAWLQKDFALGLRVLALSIVFGAASLVGGWLLGLLFGVPRTVVRLDNGTSATPPSPPASASPPVTAAPAAPDAAAAAAAGEGAAPKPDGTTASTTSTTTAVTTAVTTATTTASPSAARGQSTGVNTNLTDISDWLTKTIVGVGLTQLYQAPHFLWSSARKINEAGFQWEGHGQLLVLALFVYFSFGGFWLGYIATRTVLTELLNQIDGPDREATQAAVSLHELNIGYSGGIDPAPPGSLVAQSDAGLLNMTRDSLTSALQLAAWGAAQARAGQLAKAKEALETAHAMAPDDPVYRQLLAKVRAALGDRRGSQALGPDPWLEVFNALYEGAPHGFTTAIQKGEALALKEQESAPRSASLHLWLASAYGQKYEFEKKRNAPPETLQPIKERVLTECRTAIAIDPAVLPTLQRMWDPPPGDTDDDLVVFKDDPEFKALLGPKP
jgi:hypothetical protein